MTVNQVLCPEQGQLARLRNRLFLVQDSVPFETPDHGQVNRLELECLDDDRLGQRLSVIWEREVGAEVLQADSFPVPSGKWDDPVVFDAFLTAVKWSSLSFLSGSSLISPFKGSIVIEPFQLEPVARSVVMPRVNLLIADDVGLGKTIEAGLVLQEMISRSRVRSCLVVCPASLQRQWRDEMLTRFNLRFDIIDRDAMVRLRREYGPNVNPWRTFPRLITSMDFLKRSYVLNQFQNSLEGAGAGQDGPWDLLILDEAHNCAPAGRNRYVRDSERTRMLRQIAPHFQHRLFLTATPHNGYRESFTALLELLDPYRFQRGPTLRRDMLESIMIRRLKENLSREASQRAFARRDIDVISVPGDPAEARAMEVLDDYVASRLADAGEEKMRVPVQFALHILKKRMLSSPLAFHRSLENHLEHVTRPSSPQGNTIGDSRLAWKYMDQSREDFEHDGRKDEVEKEALRQCTLFFSRLYREESLQLDELWAWSEEAKNRPDTKLGIFSDWLCDLLKPEGRWGSERCIVFTEYLDTLEYLKNHLEGLFGEERILTMAGGMDMAKREEIKAAFQSHPDEHPVRLLLATDAAAEGLNLQNHCRNMVHYEIPWNPNRLEQRNGRIDRHGQRAEEVRIRHFLHQDNADSRFLRTVVEKVQQMRHDLGGVAAVIAEHVERRMLGDKSVELGRVAPNQTLHEDMIASVLDRQRLVRLRNGVEEAREALGVTPDAVRRVLDSALKLEGHPGLEEVEGDLAGTGALLRRPPSSWGDLCAASVTDSAGRLLTLVFNPEHVQDRRDVTLVHLNHPLMVRAMASLRKNMFALGLGSGERLNRVTYQVVPDQWLPEPVLITETRLLAVSETGQKLDEEVRSLFWSVSDQECVPYDPTRLELIPRDWSFEPIPVSLGSRLSGWIRRHEPRLRQELEELSRGKEADLQVALKDRAESEAAELRAMLQERLKEIRKILRQSEKNGGQHYLDEFIREEIEQYQEDVRRLRERLEELRERLRTEPERIREKYRLRRVNAFPLGVRFLLPNSWIRPEEGA